MNNRETHLFVIFEAPLLIIIGIPLILLIGFIEDFQNFAFFFVVMFMDFWKYSLFNNIFVSNLDD